ncbi:MAG: efflux RND transporter permease subunit [Prevotella sp.]|nr:efflux RND transporter permease subunit [Prevotella sp.]
MENKNYKNAGSDPQPPNLGGLGWLKWPLEHYSITLLIIVILFVMGIYGMYVMPKVEFPHTTIRQGVVVAVYPGATTEEVEQQVARPLERYLFTYGEVNRVKTTTTSQNGMCIVMVKLNDDVNNKDEVWSKLKHGLNVFKGQLPSGVLAIVVNDDFGNTSALLIAIESAERSYRELKDYSDRLSDRLRRIPSVANVKLYGEQKEQISLYVDRQRLQAYGIGQQILFSRLQAQGITTMSGSISDADQQVPIHIAAAENNEEEIANQIIFSDPQTGKVVRVRDVARVVREYDTMSGRIEQDGHPCVLLSMEMTPGNNVVQYGEEVESVLSSFIAEELPDDVHITRIADKPKVVALSVSSFLRDLIISMIVIILVMMVLFPLRSAIVAAITIPLSTFVSVAIMYMAGIELNIVTLAALIVVLGMIVDNSIVVIDGYLEYLGKDYEPKVAAIASARQYFMPMMLATVCICAIFFPFLLTMKGTFHDALRDFPWTITINLMVSLILAVTVIPFLEVLIIKKPTPNPSPREGSLDGSSADTGNPTPLPSGGAGGGLVGWVQQTYNRVLEWTFAHPWLTIVGGLGVIALSTLIAPTLKIRLFPYADRDQFAVEIFLPDGKGLTETTVVADSVRHVLAHDERITGITGFIGCSSPRFMDAYAPQMAGRNYAQFIVNTESDKATLELLAQYQPQLSESFPDAYVKFKRLDYLEVNELEYRFYGDDLDSLHVVAERLMERMRQMPELEWVHTDYNEPFPLINVELDPVASAQLGITRTTAALALSATTNDLRVGQLWKGNYELPIVVKDDSDMTFSDIENIGVATPVSMASAALNNSNTTVPLRQVAKVSPQWSESRIVHRGGERCITVTAQFAQGVYTAPVEQRIAEIMQQEIPLPEGVRSEVGGEIEYGDEAMPQIIGGIVVAMIIVFFFLLFNFKKYGITTICMAALGLMIPGALIGLGLMDRALGLTSIFGLITLMGMIMRNEILILEHANNLVHSSQFIVHSSWQSQATEPSASSQKDGAQSNYELCTMNYELHNEAVRQAAYEAGKRRMVPIFLTTATTAVGVLPMIIAQSSFWMPVGVTIFAGGIGSLIMVVTMLPVVYWKVNLKGKKVKK